MLEIIIQELGKLEFDLRLKIDQLEIKRAQCEMDKQYHLKDLEKLHMILKTCHALKADQEKPKNEGEHLPTCS